MKTHKGTIQYNEELKCYGMLGLDGNWIKEKLEDGDKIDIVLGNELFHTKFREGDYKPSLQPLPWDNWDYLSGKPATYYDFELPPKAPPVSEEKRKKHRVFSAVSMVAIAVLLNALLALTLSWISSGDKSFTDSFRITFTYCFVLFGGGFGISAFLLLVTTMPEDKALTYGAGFYYGTYACFCVLGEFLHMADLELALVLSAIIVGLCCYIFWLKSKLKT